LYEKSSAIPVEELKIFELLKEEFSVVFDVGAREDLSFFQIKNNCEYHLFEPNSEFVNNLKNKIYMLEKHNIILNEFGLSDKEESNCIYYESSQSFVINPFAKGKDKGHRYNLMRLDDYVHKNKIQHIDFLKIDAEGLDYKVIKGGINTVRTQVSYIQFEFWGGVQNFYDLLCNEFNLYLLMEPGLYSAITKDIYHLLTDKQKEINFNISLISITPELIDLLDNILSPRGCAGNILGIKKELGHEKHKKITFKITYDVS